jgi:hypothetical protein
MGEVGEVQVRDEAHDPGEELPEPLGDEALGAGRRVGDLVHEGAGIAVAEVGR